MILDFWDPTPTLGWGWLQILQILLLAALVYLGAALVNLAFRKPKHDDSFCRAPGCLRCAWLAKERERQKKG